MFDCMIAAKFPTTMVARAHTHTTGIQCDAAVCKLPMNMRIKTANAAALGPTVRNAETGAGAP